MVEWAKYKIPWPEFYDTAALVDGADLSAGQTLIVDVGGHHGVDILRVLDKHPNLPAGSLVLQDLADVVSSVNIGTDKIKVMAHDFFEAQPIYGKIFYSIHPMKRVRVSANSYGAIGSRAYFFHAVFHDWSDSAAIKILQNIAPAMKKGYSKLLICDVVIPATGASIFQAVMDVNMMSIVSGYERTKNNWMSLINEAGFKIVGIYKDTRNYEAVIEAELA